MLEVQHHLHDAVGWEPLERTQDGHPGMPVYRMVQLWGRPLVSVQLAGKHGKDATLIVSHLCINHACRPTDTWCCPFEYSTG